MGDPYHLAVFSLVGRNDFFQGSVICDGCVLLNDDEITWLQGLVSAVSISGSSGTVEDIQLTNAARNVGPSFGTDSNDVVDE